MSLLNATANFLLEIKVLIHWNIQLPEKFIEFIH